jgi:hypothetical protein
VSFQQILLFHGLLSPLGNLSYYLIRHRKLGDGTTLHYHACL